MQVLHTDPELPSVLSVEEVQTKGLLDQRLPRYYANNVALIVSPWDLRLIFSEIVASSAEEKVVLVQPNVAVSLSLQMAKALHRILEVNIAAYEAKIGEVKMPKEILAEPASTENPSATEQS